MHVVRSANAGAIVGLCLGILLIIIVVAAAVTGFKGYLSTPSTYYKKYVHVSLAGQCFRTEIKEMFNNVHINTSLRIVSFFDGIFVPINFIGY